MIFNMTKSLLIAFDHQAEGTMSLKSETIHVTPTTPPVPTQMEPRGGG